MVGNLRLRGCALHQGGPAGFETFDVALVDRGAGQPSRAATLADSGGLLVTGKYRTNVQ